MKTGADTGPCPSCGEPNGGRYRHADRWLCWDCLPASWRREPRRRKLKPDPYVVFSTRVWEGIERHTGHRPFVLEPGRWRSYCPVCLSGYLELRFSWTLKPLFVGTCSNGCTDRDIGAVLFT